MAQIPQTQSGPPTDKVLFLRQQGMSNNQIIQSLQREGHETADIFDAMSQADIKRGVEGTAMPEQSISKPMQYAPEPRRAQPSFQPRAQPSFSAPSGPPMGMPPLSGSDSPELQRIEELAEAIIDEKWNEIVRSINKIVDWKERTEGKIIKLEQSMADLKADFDGLHKALVGKIGEYDKNLSSVGSEIKAMEKVFQKVIPTLTENVNELDRITRGIKFGGSAPSERPSPRKRKEEEEEPEEEPEEAEEPEEDKEKEEE